LIHDRLRKLIGQALIMNADLIAVVNDQLLPPQRHRSVNDVIVLLGARGP
jgi:HD-like signal output (HDOD) protein